MIVHRIIEIWTIHRTVNTTPQREWLSEWIPCWSNKHMLAASYHEEVLDGFFTTCFNNNTPVTVSLHGATVYLTLHMFRLFFHLIWRNVKARCTLLILGWEIWELFSSGTIQFKILECQWAKLEQLVMFRVARSEQKFYPTNKKNWNYSIRWGIEDWKCVPLRFLHYLVWFAGK